MTSPTPSDTGDLTAAFTHNTGGTPMNSGQNPTAVDTVAGSSERVEMPTMLSSSPPATEGDSGYRLDRVDAHYGDVNASINDRENEVNEVGAMFGADGNAVKNGTAQHFTSDYTSRTVTSINDRIADMHQQMQHTYSGDQQWMHDAEQARQDTFAQIDELTEQLPVVGQQFAESVTSANTGVDALNEMGVDYANQVAEQADRADRDLWDKVYQTTGRIFTATGSDLQSQWFLERQPLPIMPNAAALDTALSSAEAAGNVEQAMRTAVPSPSGSEGAHIDRPGPWNAPQTEASSPQPATSGGSGGSGSSTVTSPSRSVGGSSGSGSDSTGGSTGGSSLDSRRREASEIIADIVSGRDGNQAQTQPSSAGMSMMGGPTGPLDAALAQTQLSTGGAPMSGAQLHSMLTGNDPFASTASASPGGRPLGAPEQAPMMGGAPLSTGAPVSGSSSPLSGTPGGASTGSGSGSGAAGSGDPVRRTALGADMKPLDRDGSGKMDPDATPATRENMTNPDGTPKVVDAEISVGDETRSVPLSDPRLAEMMNHVGQADPDSPVTILDAAGMTEMPLDDYGTQIDDVSQIKPGDVVTSDKGTGFYLGDGEVLTEQGEIVPVADVLDMQSLNPEHGVFRLDLPELPSESEDSDLAEGGAARVSGEPEVDEQEDNDQGGPPTATTGEHDPFADAPGTESANAGSEHDPAATAEQVQETVPQPETAPDPDPPASTANELPTSAPPTTEPLPERDESAEVPAEAISHDSAPEPVSGSLGAALDEATGLSSSEGEDVTDEDTDDPGIKEVPYEGRPLGDAPA